MCVQACMYELEALKLRAKCLEFELFYVKDGETRGNIEGEKCVCACIGLWCAINVYVYVSLT